MWQIIPNKNNVAILNTSDFTKCDMFVIILMFNVHVILLTVEKLDRKSIEWYTIPNSPVVENIIWKCFALQITTLIIVVDPILIFL